MTPAALVALLALPAATTVQPPSAGAAAAAPAPTAARPAGADTAARRAGTDTAARRRRGDQRAPRRLPVTPALEASAYGSADARALLQRARAARLAQDSALAAYEANTYQRLSAGMGVRAFGRERLLMRAESAARVTWSRSTGVTVQPTGSRAVFPSFLKDEVGGEVNLDGAAPIPHFPGRDALWLPLNAFGVAKAEVNDREFVHPLASGSEAYYRYAAGGATSIRLPDGRVIALRELRVSPRRPEWRLFVGSFWFDAGTGQLVRAAYRMSTDLDVWQVAGDENRAELEEALERARRDTSAAARRAVDAARREAKDDEAPGWVKGTFSPLTATIGAVTVEYGLYEGRFWLPRRHVAEGNARAGFMRFPFSFEERYRYDRVEGGGATAAPPRAAAPRRPRRPRPRRRRARRSTAPSRSPAPTRRTATTRPGSASTSPSAAGATRGAAPRPTPRAPTRRSAPSRARPPSRRAAPTRCAPPATPRGPAAPAAPPATPARAPCASPGVRSPAAAAPPRTTRAPRSATTARSRSACAAPATPPRSPPRPTCPASPYAPGEVLFSEAERDALLASLDFSLQPGWAPQPPVLRTGLSFARFNRVEGLSWGGSATSALGRGYTAEPPRGSASAT
jgi:hypothetical protein